jgi:F-box protein 9
VYREAVLAEQRGELDEALTLYRRAFRQEANIDKFYHQQESISRLLLNADVPSSATPVKPELIPGAVSHEVPKPSAPWGDLADLMAVFPEDSSFLPEEDKEYAPFTDFPEEVVVHILRRLDPTSIERFAAVCRKARVITLDPVIWRYVRQ